MTPAEQACTRLDTLDAAAAAAPSVLVVLADQFTVFALHEHAHGYRTAHAPNLRRLASLGLTVQHAYTVAPVCAVARASLVSGEYPQTTGVVDNGKAWPLTTATFGEVFKASGYVTGWFGKVHSGQSEEDGDWGFDRVISEESSDWSTVRSALIAAGGGGGDTASTWSDDDADRVATSATLTKGVRAKLQGDEWTNQDRLSVAVALDWMADRDAAGESWLAVVSLVRPHYPWSLPTDYHGAHSGSHCDAGALAADPGDQLVALEAADTNMGSVSDEEIGTFRASYLDAVEFIDAQIGELLDYCETLAELPIIVFTADHGEQAGHHGVCFKGVLMEPTMRIPMVMVAPSLPVGDTYAGLVSGVDLAPTLCALAGLDMATTGGQDLSRPLALNAPSCGRLSAYGVHRVQNVTIPKAFAEACWTFDGDDVLKLVEYTGKTLGNGDVLTDEQRHADLMTDPLETESATLTTEQVAALDSALSVLRTEAGDQK